MAAIHQMYMDRAVHRVGSLPGSSGDVTMTIRDFLLMLKVKRRPSENLMVSVKLTKFAFHPGIWLNSRLQWAVDGALCDFGVCEAPSGSDR